MVTGSPAAPRVISARRRLAARLAGVVGGLLMVASFGALSAALVGGSQIGSGDTYAWRTGSELFLENVSDRATANCTISGVVARFVTIPGTGSRPFGLFATNGAWVHRDQPGDEKVTCDHNVAVSSGPLLAIYPLAATPFPFLAGLLLLVAWHVGVGGRGGRWLFGPRTRPLLGP